MTTGPHSTEYQIPDITLGDTFNEWRTTTNDGIIDKLNRMKVYTGKSGDGISVGMKVDGETVIEHSGHVLKGVTFSGPVTFNGAYTVVNAQEFQVDDYIIMLGATGGVSAGGAGAADNVISAQGGGGLQILRSDGVTATFLWKPDMYGGTQGTKGTTGTWYVEGPNIGLTNAAWFVSEDDTFRFHTNKKQAANTALGVIIGQDATNSRNNSEIRIQSTGGNIYPVLELGTRGAVDGVTNEAFSKLVNGSVVRRVSKTGHGFSFGSVVRYDASLGWTYGIANTEEGAEAVGIVSSTTFGGNTFDVAYSGEVVGDFREINEEIGANGLGKTLSPGSVYFLSTSAHGKITSLQPTTANHINKPVLVALDPIGPNTGGTSDRAVIVNYRGALVPDAASDITEQVQNRILIDQVNDFVVGDLVRFERDVHYGWSGDQPGVTGDREYGSGVWQRGQANSKEEAEILGMVTAVNVAGDRNKFYITLNGKLDFTGARAQELGITAGKVYFLSANSAPDGRGGLGLSGESLTTIPPLTDGHVKKPFAVSISATEMIILNYVGEVIGEGQGGGGGGGSTTVITSPVGSIIAWSGTADAAPENWKLCDGSLLSQSQYPELYGEIGHQYIFAGHDVDENGVAVPDETEETLNAEGVFRIPDLRNRMIIGQNAENPDGSPPYGLTFDSSLGPLTHGITLGEQGGEMVHKLSSAESGLKSHSHGDDFAVASKNLGSHSHNVKTHIATDHGWAQDATFAGNPNDFLGKAGGGNVSDVVISTNLGSHSHTLTGSVSTNSGSAASNAHNILTPYIGLRYIIKTKPDEQAAASGTTTVLDAGRNLFVNGNFDFWQRMHSDENNGDTHQAGRSADRFAPNTNDIGGAYTDHANTTEISQRFFADRWGLVKYSEDNGAAGVAKWNGAATNGGVSRHRFTLSNANETLPVLQRSHAESKPANYYLRLTCNLAGCTAPGIEQRIEGVDTVHNEKATISFWARRKAGTATSLHGVHVSLQGFASGTGDYRGTNTSDLGGGVGTNYKMYDELQSPTFKLNTSWTKYVYTFDIPSIVGVCAGNATGSPVDGTDVPANAWQLISGGGAIPREGFIGVRIQPLPDGYDKTSNPDFRWSGEFDIAQVQFERGSTETEFDSYNMDDELKRCERYYQQSFGPFGCTGTGVDTRTAKSYSRKISGVRYMDRSISNVLHGSHSFRTEMRHTPRVKIFSLTGVEGNVNGPDESSVNWQSEDGIGIETGKILGDDAHTMGFSEVQFNIPSDTDGGAGQNGQVWKAQDDPHYDTRDKGNFIFHYTAEAEI